MRRTAQLLAGIALLGGCGGEPVITETTAAMRPSAATAAASQASPATEHKDLAALRAATAQFHRIDVAKAAGYDVQFPAGCFTSAAGAMGFHYLNGAKVGTLKVTEPQLMMYEPQKNGTMKLVGFEYIVPGVPSETPPVLFDRAFEYNATFGVWALHVWAWKHNPQGMFSDWNPKVTCEYATAVSTAAHL